MTDDRPRDGYDLDAWIVARGLSGLQAAALFGVTDITMVRARKHGQPSWFGLPMLFRIADLIDLREAETRAGILHRPARLSRNQKAGRPLHLIPLPPRRAVTLGDRIDARHTRRPEPTVTTTMQAGDAAALLHALTALPDGGPRCHRAMRALHDAITTAARDANNATR
jgi:hypothetical protein